jgi:hypothetical protein
MMKERTISGIGDRRTKSVTLVNETVRVKLIGIFSL